MGRKSRAKAERRTSRENGLHLVVATLPEDQVEYEQELRNDLRLVRSALLYADTVELCSPMATLASSTAGGFGSRDPLATLEFLISCGDTMLDGFIPGETSAQARQSLRDLHELLSIPRSMVRKLPAEDAWRIDQARKEVANMTDLDELIERTGAYELEQAIEAGVLTLVETRIDLDDTDAVLTDRFTTLLTDLLTSSSKHVLLDEAMADLASTLAGNGSLSASDLALDRAGRSSLGTGLIHHLPAFPDAPVSSILEARAELDESRRRYRGHLGTLEKEINSGPLDPGRASEISDLWRDTVDPAMHDLRRDLSKTRLAREAGLAAASDKGSWGALTLGGGALHAGVLPTDLWTAAGAFTAVTTAAGRATAQALKDAQARRHSARSHGLYYLLQLEDRL